MSENLTKTTMKKVVTNPQVFNHLIKLQERLQKDFINGSKDNPHQYSSGIIEAIQESPNTTNWVKTVVIPKIHDGNEGLDEILIEIENEKNTLLSATRMQIVLDILQTLTESLDDLKNGVEQGEYDLDENIENFSNEIAFKTYH